MIITHWVLWFVITVLHGEKMHFPVNTEYTTQEACEKDIPEWEALIREQFEGDQNLEVYCEESTIDLPTKGI